MRAWIVKDTATGAVSLTDIATPQPQAGEVLLRVKAAALNFSDILMARGQYQVRPPVPFTPGQEVAGIVEAVGLGAGIEPGTRIASKVLWGGFANYALVRADMAIVIPDAMSDAEAACLPVVYPTAHIGLHDRGRLQAGESVLVHAAAGGVGMAALQLAVAAGAKVIATAGGPDKLALCRQRGAIAAFDYRKADWLADMQAQCGEVDLVFDPVGGEIAEQSLKALAYRGRYLIVGFASGAIPAIKANRLLLKNASALGVYWSHERDKDVIDSALADILDLWRRGALELDVGQNYPFADLPRALEELAARKTIGKSILHVD